MPPHQPHCLRQMRVQQSLPSDKVNHVEPGTDSFTKMRSSTFKLFNALKLLDSKRAIMRTTLTVEIAIITKDKLKAQRLASMSLHRRYEVADFFEYFLHFIAKIQKNVQYSKELTLKDNHPPKPLTISPTPLPTTPTQKLSFLSPALSFSEAPQLVQ